MEFVREAAAFSLGSLDDSRAVEPLTAATADESERVRLPARSSLERLEADRMT